MKHNLKHWLVNAIVTKVIHNDEYDDIIHGIVFKKNDKYYMLRIEGWECETSLKPLTKE